MKKFVFSAVAMMAFSGGLMASNIANQEINQLDPDCDGAVIE